MNMPLPTNAKITALVCSGRSRPNVVNWRFRFRSGQNNWHAMSSPALKPTRPQMTVAMADDAVVVFEGFDVGVHLIFDLA